MRKLKLQMQQSVDGFVGGPNGELDWMTWTWDDELKQFVTDLTGTMDTIVMGRKMASGFIPYWKNVAENPEDPQQAFGKIMHETPKVVFSKTLSPDDAEISTWQNTKLAQGELSEEINQLKQQNGKDIIVYGGANFVSSLVAENLIDELYLFVNPTAIGKGLSIFKDRTNLALEKTYPFSCGITVLKYQPAK